MLLQCSEGSKTAHTESPEVCVAPPDVEIAPPGNGVPDKQAVEQRGRFHHSAVLPQVIVRLHQEGVRHAIASNEGDLHGTRVSACLANKYMSCLSTVKKHNEGVYGVEAYCS